MQFPNANQYIDIHSHSNWNYPHIYSIRCLSKPEELENYREFARPITLGLHPWYIDPRTSRKVLEMVAEAAEFQTVLAIGECGIDLKIDLPYEQQEKVFLKQLAIAEKAQKPLIIHCVRAYQQLTNILLGNKPGVPWIFHGFNNNEQVAAELIRNGAYLSIGADLLKENSKIRKSFGSIPLNRIFLETDDWQQPVWKLYAEATRLLSIPEKELKFQILENFKACFSSVVKDGKG
jgi:TatD DNase family protein